MNENLLNQINCLSNADRAELINYLLAQSPHEQNIGELSDWQKKELDEDYKQYLANPMQGTKWQEVKARIMKDNGL